MQRVPHIQRPSPTRLALSLMLVLAAIFGTLRVSGQMVPDDVCVGTTKHYWVDPTPGSTYTWMINGVPQPSTTNQIDVLWDLPYTPAGSPYTISVQEKSAAGCDGLLWVASSKISPRVITLKTMNVFLFFIMSPY